MKAGAIRLYDEHDKDIKYVTCPCCNSLINVTLDRTVQSGIVLFIPFIKMNVRYYSSCSNCGVDIIYTKRLYNQIKNSANPQKEWNEVSKICYDKAKRKSEERIKRSPKNKYLAALLSLIGCPLGFQNLYLGHKKRFIINLSFFAIAAMSTLLLLITKSSAFILISTVPLAANIYWGLFDFFRVLLGYAKDSKGCYLLTDNEYKKRLLMHAIMS